MIPCSTCAFGGGEHGRLRAEVGQGAGHQVDRVYSEDAADDLVPLGLSGAADLQVGVDPYPVWVLFERVEVGPWLEAF